MTGLLVLAKAPVAGRVKTRLGAEVGMERAAALAAAALLDTLRAATDAFGPDRCALALDGDLADAVGGDDLVAAVAGWTVFGQTGEGLGERLLHAHQDAHTLLGGPVVQIGMDTPQAGPALLRRAADALLTRSDAVLGRATDGGWWLLGVGDPALAAGLPGVPMSAPTTGAATAAMLLAAGAHLIEIESLQDVDTAADADAVAVLASGTAFAEVWR